MASSPFTLRDLELLLALHHTGSLKRASEQLQCTPSALSHRVHDLESRVGHVLVERHGKLHLTSLAQKLMPRAEQILALSANLTADLSELGPTRTVGVSNLLLNGPYLSAVADFIAAKAQDFDVRLGHSRAIEDWVEQGTADLGLVRLERVRPGLHYQLVEEDRLTVVSTRPMTANQALKSSWVLFPHSMGHGAAVHRALADAGLIIQAKAVVDSFTLALELVERGWLSVLPWSRAAAPVQTGRMVELTLPNVIWPPRRNAVVTKDVEPAWAGVLVKTLRGRLHGGSTTAHAPGRGRELD